jgi:predicted phosphoadenosine phosphosulfate sulfurtransferase
MRYPKTKEAKPEDKVSKKFTYCDVLTASKERLKYIMSIFDDWYVLFSGGKDSLVVLHLVEEVQKELGMHDKKINVIHRDLELAPIDAVNYIQQRIKPDPKYNLEYYAVQGYGTKFVLGGSYNYVDWDNSRKETWIRQKPDYAIEGDPNKIYDKETLHELMMENKKGHIIFLTGVRADESPTRLRSIKLKKNDCFIGNTHIPNLKMGKPIYDWSEKDVFRYFYDRGINYCEIYDKQMWNFQPLRVSTPLHPETAKVFDKFKTLQPEMYDKLVEIFPEMMVQERYWKEFDRYGVIDKYEKSWNGIIQYIRENIPDKKKRYMAIKKVLAAKSARENKIKKDKSNIRNLGGFPLLHVFKTVINGGYIKYAGLAGCSTLNKSLLDYELESVKQGLTTDVTEEELLQLYESLGINVDGEGQENSEEYDDSMTNLI